MKKAVKTAPKFGSPSWAYSKNGDSVYLLTDVETRPKSIVVWIGPDDDYEADAKVNYEEIDILIDALRKMKRYIDSERKKQNEH